MAGNLHDHRLRYPGLSQLWGISGGAYQSEDEIRSEVAHMPGRYRSATDQKGEPTERLGLGHPQFIVLGYYPARILQLNRFSSSSLIFSMASVSCPQ
jgi:hypothetical protein